MPQRSVLGDEITDKIGPLRLPHTAIFHRRRLFELDGARLELDDALDQRGERLGHELAQERHQTLCESGELVTRYAGVPTSLARDRVGDQLLHAAAQMLDDTRRAAVRAHGVTNLIPVT